MSRPLPATIGLVALTATLVVPTPALAQGETLVVGTRQTSTTYQELCGQSDSYSPFSTMSCSSGGATWTGSASAGPSSVAIAHQVTVGGVNPPEQAWWQTYGTAQWRDKVTQTGGVQAAKMRITIGWTGTMWGSAAGASCSGLTYLQQQFLVMDRTNYLDIWNSPVNYGTIPQNDCFSNLSPRPETGSIFGTFGQTASYDVPFVFGMAEFMYGFNGSNTIYHPANGSSFSGSMGVDFDASLLSIRMLDENDQDVTNAGTYSFANGSAAATSATPEPGSLLLIATGAGALAARRRRRG